jgi:predicted alpha/beta hydrolase
MGIFLLDNVALYGIKIGFTHQARLGRKAGFVRWFSAAIETIEAWVKKEVLFTESAGISRLSVEEFSCWRNYVRNHSYRR